MGAKNGCGKVIDVTSDLDGFIPKKRRKRCRKRRVQYANMMRKTNTKELCQWKVRQIRQLQLVNCIRMIISLFCNFLRRFRSLSAQFANCDWRIWFKVTT